MHNINFIKLLKNMSIHLKFKILDYFVYFIQYTYNVFTKVSMTPVSHCLVNESTSNETFHGNTFVILLPVGIMLRVLKCSAQIRITSVRTIHVPFGRQLSKIWLADMSNFWESPLWKTSEKARNHTRRIIKCKAYAGYAKGEKR